MTEATQTTTPETKLTRREKLAEQYGVLAAKRADFIKKADEIALKQSEIALEVQGIDDLANVGVGSDVIVGLGKGDTAKKVPGKVLAVRDEEDGSRSYKVQHGTGFDTDVTVVKANKIELPAQPAVELTPDNAPAAE